MRSNWKPFMIGHELEKMPNIEDGFKDRRWSSHVVQLERNPVKTFAYNVYGLSGGATIKLSQNEHGNLTGRRILEISAAMSNTQGVAYMRPTPLLPTKMSICH